ncbi:hypothetical protein [Streptantibioticus silvisoli]|uniref:Uncharacterized protein n=1 Tax=Streptantibioticus silvisoli TaxID=2705255 RepID=A0ABT6W452_9ACTN|nr:hypothetical protein [Streptantibioticus silvisoli]MDI5965532.1 hypothetical protein [Streptantibioticus silvisoli]
MQSNRNNGRAHYRYRFPNEYAIANKLDHPVTGRLWKQAPARSWSSGGAERSRPSALSPRPTSP